MADKEPTKAPYTAEAMEEVRGQAVTAALVSLPTVACVGLQLNEDGTRDPVVLGTVETKEGAKAILESARAHFADSHKIRDIRMCTAVLVFVWDGADPNGPSGVTVEGVKMKDNE